MLQDAWGCVKIVTAQSVHNDHKGLTLRGKTARASVVTTNAPPRRACQSSRRAYLSEHAEMIAATTTITAITAIPARRLQPVAIAPMIGGPASIPL